MKEKFNALKAAYPGHRLVIVSNTAGALSYDSKRELASELEKTTGVTVLSHQTKKPGCGPEIMEYFRKHPETGVTSPSQVAVVGDRLSTDMMLANMMGSYGVWVKDGVVPIQQKSIVSIFFRHCYKLYLLIYKFSSQGWSRDLGRTFLPEGTALPSHRVHLNNPYSNESHHKRKFKTIWTAFP